jgi:neutral ceramidase
MTMVNGAAKYLPDERSYQRITYEAMASHYARGAAELVAAGILSFLGDLR